MSAEKIALADIVVDPSIQPRTKGLDEDHVEELQAAYEAGETLPRPTVWRIGRALKLSQGFHRIEAAKRAGLKHLLCDVHMGSEQDCALDAFASNQGHGLKRSNEDKRRAIRCTLKLVPKWTDSRIADKLGVSDKTVEAERFLMESVSEIPRHSERVGRDGRTYQAKEKVRTPRPLKTPSRPAPVGPPPTPEPVRPRTNLSHGPRAYAGRLRQVAAALDDLESVVGGVLIWPQLARLVGMAGGPKWEPCKERAAKEHVLTNQAVRDLRAFCGALAVMLDREPEEGLNDRTLGGMADDLDPKNWRKVS